MTRIIRRRASLITAVAILLAAGGAAVFAARAYSARAITVSESGLTAPRVQYPAAQPQIPDEGVEAEVITLRPNGFEPKEISRPRGPFLLAAQNRAGIESISLQLNRVTGQREHQVQVPRGRSRWSRLFDLPPGEYVLTEAGHPEWACRITITPQ